MPFGGLLTVGAIGAGSSLFGSLFGASKAANAQVKSAQIAADTQLKMYDQSRADLAPWRGAGGGAVGQMSELLMPGGFADQQYDPATFAQDPGYQFRLEEGQKALERSASSRGQTLSGGALKSLAGYSQGMASQEYGKAYERWNNQRLQKWNMLQGVANMGMGAAGQTVQAGSSAANQISEAQMGAGNAQGAAYMNMGNAISGAGNNLSQLYMMQNLFKPQNPGPAPQANLNELSSMGMTKPLP